MPLLISFYKKITCCCTLPLFLLVIAPGETVAQNPRVNVDLQISERLSQSEVLNLAEIMRRRGGGSNLFELIIENEESERIEELYLSVRLKSDQGTLVDIYQRSSTPFHLDPNQMVFTNRFDEFPGIDESLLFDGGLTSEGEEFVNDLEGTIRLDDELTAEVFLHQGANIRDGGREIASAQVSVGSGLVEDIRDIYLTTPGDAPGSDTEIFNSFPEFRWEGPSNVRYRLIVVEQQDNETPESLIQGALSTSPTIRNNQSAGGSLLEYEMLDVQLNDVSFQYPSSGVQKLQSGRTYYWQVIAELKGSDQQVQQSSEIWEFSLGGVETESVSESAENPDELENVLREIMGEAEYSEMENDGFQLESIEVDGVTISDSEAYKQLIEFKQRIDAGEVTTQD